MFVLQVASQSFFTIAVSLVYTELHNYNEQAFNTLSTNLSKEFVGCCRRIGSVCLTILWGWCFKD